MQGTTKQASVWGRESRLPQSPFPPTSAPLGRLALTRLDLDQGSGRPTRDKHTGTKVPLPQSTEGCPGGAPELQPALPAWLLHCLETPWGSSRCLAKDFWSKTGDRGKGTPS